MDWSGCPTNRRRSCSPLCPEPGGVDEESARSLDGSAGRRSTCVADEKRHGAPPRARPDHRGAAAPTTAALSARSTPIGSGCTWGAYSARRRFKRPQLPVERHAPLHPAIRPEQRLPVSNVSLPDPKLRLDVVLPDVPQPLLVEAG